MNSSNHLEEQSLVSEEASALKIPGHVQTFRGSLHSLLELYQSDELRVKTMLVAAGLNIDPVKSLREGADEAFLALRPHGQGTVQERVNRMIQSARKSLAGSR